GGRRRRPGQPVAHGAGRGRLGEPLLPDLPSMRAQFVEPMKAKLAHQPSKGGDWIYELKFDGIRLLAVKIVQKVSLLSRNQNELAGRFPEIVEAVKNLSVRECVMDGEVAALAEW